MRLALDRPFPALNTGDIVDRMEVLPSVRVLVPGAAVFEALRMGKIMRAHSLQLQRCVYQGLMCDQSGID